MHFTPEFLYLFQYGDSPLHTATRYGHAELLPVLLSVDLRRDYMRKTTTTTTIINENQRHINLQNAVRTKYQNCA